MIEPIAAGGRVVPSAELTDLLVAMPDVEVLLRDAAVRAASALAPGVSCGITILRDGPPVTAAASDELGPAVDEQQYEMDEGPCLDAARHHEPVDVPVFEEEGRWPRFRSRALAAGVRSSYSLPLVVDDRSVGAANFYGDRPARFGATERAYAGAYTAEVGKVLRVALRHVEQVELIGQLREALTSRATIDQAIGILIARQRISPEEAFALLRRASQNSNLKLRDVAAALVRSASRGH
ncbi:GAF and ANTAR domain-containing protein [Cryptosporangium japonicum]|uniref:ANTAR domain-containing protein n=1 Tax=Cryptosporangium japonicum TaxID=80872 RepID=A0ABP3E7G1_9ACTN